MMVPTAIPEMAPGDKSGRVVVTGGVAEERYDFSIPAMHNFNIAAMGSNVPWKPNEWH